MLIDDIVRFAPGAELDVTRFTSGAFDITVRYRGRAFVVAFVRELGFGVSELGPDSSFEGHDAVFAEAIDAASYLRTLLLDSKSS